MFICQKSEGVHPYLLKCCRGTCSLVGMLKGCMVRKRLGTPDLVEPWLSEVTEIKLHEVTNSDPSTEAIQELLDIEFTA